MLLSLIQKISSVFGVVMLLLCLPQVVYTLVGFFVRHKKQPPAAKQHRYAALLCARNEENVIGELIGCLKGQDYPADLLDVYVLADNCTDQTAEAAEAAGAIVYRRQDTTRVGKGYALDHLLARIREEKGLDTYDGYFVFDADNLLEKDFVTAMNRVFDRGYEVVTSYRNSKNFGENWITAGYSIWFLREARFLHSARMRLKTGCAVSGTGFLVSSRIIKENGGWPFHMLTEDIEFSVDCAIKGRRIGYCDDAILYDEQPADFGVSCRQRRRWSKGFYQIVRHYTGRLLRGILHTKGGRFACLDLFVILIPCVVLLISLGLLSAQLFTAVATLPAKLLWPYLLKMFRSLLESALLYYLGMMAYGLLTVLREWRRIPASTAEKLVYLPLFPLFMATHLPVTLAAFFSRVGWDPIAHRSSGAIRAKKKEEALGRNGRS